jgi:hypothetical protein
MGNEKTFIIIIIRRREKKSISNKEAEKGKGKGTRKDKKVNNDKCSCMKYGIRYG